MNFYYKDSRGGSVVSGDRELGKDLVGGTTFVGITLQIIVTTARYYGNMEALLR
ncbi:MAG: hypothetical protein H6Q69_402 [Firmicutes bacterium]|nr:hypothetical protein [Bacillota bacterium]